MTLEELETEVYEDLNGRVTAARFAPEAFEFDFECDHWREDRRVAVTIVCSDVLESTLSVGFVGGIERPQEHPLLWRYMHPGGYLYFSSPPTDPFELLGRLHSVHEALFEGWRPARDHIHASAEMLSSGHGQLAHGPIIALQAYKQVASAFVHCSLVQPSAPYMPNTQCQLILFDDAFIICGDVVLRHSLENA